MLFGLEKLDEGTPDFLCFHGGSKVQKLTILVSWPIAGAFYRVTKLTEMAGLCSSILGFWKVAENPDKAVTDLFLSQKPAKQTNVRFLKANGQNML